MSITSLGSMGIGISVNDTKSMNAIDTAMLKKTLDSVEMSGDMLTKMMEQSVNPNIGSHIDIRI